jgi:Arc/MetJ family transcription regulator
MKLYRMPTKRAAIDFALRALVGDKKDVYKDLLDLQGIGWEGDLDEMRRASAPPGS